MTATLCAEAGEADVVPQSPKAPSPTSTLRQTAQIKRPWERIVMVGASVSAGFTQSEPLGGPITQQCRLSRYLDAALLVPHEPVRNLGNTFFFIGPEAEGRNQIEQALKSEPTLVVAIDFIFWFCYGYLSTDDDRLQRLEKGLTLLESIRCPLLLGDIPDASAAANGILDEKEIPSARVISAANRRLRGWAASRKHIVLLPLSDFMRVVAANQAFTIHGRTLPAGKTGALLQEDRLHPSPAGCAVLALAVMDALQSAQPTVFAGEVRWNLGEVLRLGAGLAHGSTSNPARPTAPASSAGR